MKKRGKSEKATTSEPTKGVYKFELTYKIAKSVEKFVAKLLMHNLMFQL